MIDLDLKVYSCVVKSDDIVSTYNVIAENALQVLEYLGLGEHEELQSLSLLFGTVILPEGKNDSHNQTLE